MKGQALQTPHAVAFRLLWFFHASYFALPQQIDVNVLAPVNHDGFQWGYILPTHAAQFGEIRSQFNADTAGTACSRVVSFQKPPPYEYSSSVQSVDQGEGEGCPHYQEATSEDGWLTSSLATYAIFLTDSDSCQQQPRFGRRAVVLVPCEISTPEIEGMLAKESQQNSYSAGSSPVSSLLGYPLSESSVYVHEVEIESPDEFVITAILTEGPVYSDDLNNAALNSTCESFIGIGDLGEADKVVVKDSISAKLDTVFRSHIPFPAAGTYWDTSEERAIYACALGGVLDSDNLNWPRYQHVLDEDGIRVDLKFDSPQEPACGFGDEEDFCYWTFDYLEISGVVEVDGGTVSIPFFYVAGLNPLLEMRYFPRGIKHVSRTGHYTVAESTKGWLQKFYVIGHETASDDPGFTCVDDDDPCLFLTWAEDCPCVQGECDYQNNGVSSPCTCFGAYEGPTCSERPDCDPGYKDMWHAECGGEDDCDCSDWDCECQPCDENTFSSDGIICEPCPTGQQSGVGASACSVCLPGQVPREGNPDECDSCLFGFSSVAGDETCKPCLPGKYAVAEEERNLCVNCPAGKESLEFSSVECTDCDLGEWKLDGELANCTMCDMGSYRGEGTEGCALTQPGEYVDVMGATETKPCPAGLYSRKEGQTACEECEAGKVATSDQNGCDSCGAGFYVSTNSTSCTACQAGTFGSNGLACSECSAGYYNEDAGQGSCDECPRGTYIDLDGMTFCFDCPAGRSSEDGSTTCVLCEPLMYAPISGSRACQPCPTNTYPDVARTTCDECLPGTYYGGLNVTTCVDCPVGRYGNTTGLTQCTSCVTQGYSATEGQSECTKCPISHMNTFGDDARSALDCTCVAGYYGSRTAADGATEDFCSICPNGGKCVDESQLQKGSDFPLPVSGFYMDNAFLSPVECSPIEACPGGELQLCVEGYEGYICSECKDGYYRLVNFCEKCPSSSVPWPLIIGIVVLVVVLFLAVKILPKYRHLQSNAISCLVVLLNGIQVLSIFSGLGVGWPSALKDLLNFLSIFNFNIEMVNPECSVGSFGVLHKLILVTLLPVILYIVMLLINLLRGCVKTEAARDGRRLWQLPPGDIQICAGVVFVLYVQLSGLVFSGFDCTAKTDGQSYLDVDPAQVCDFADSTYMVIFLFSSFGLIVYVLGVPIFLALFFYRNRCRINSKQLMSEYGFLYERYERRWYWYEVIQLCRRSLILAVTTFATNNPIVQIMGSLAILNIALLIHLYSRPFLFQMVDRVETIALIANTFVMFCALVFYADSQSRLHLDEIALATGQKPQGLLTDNVEASLVVMNFIFIIGMIGFTFASVLLEIREVTRTSTEHKIVKDIAGIYVMEHVESMDAEEIAKLAALFQSGWNPIEYMQKKKGHSTYANMFQGVEMLQDYIRANNSESLDSTKNSISLNSTGKSTKSNTSTKSTDLGMTGLMAVSKFKSSARKESRRSSTTPSPRESKSSKEKDFIDFMTIVEQVQKNLEANGTSFRRLSEESLRDLFSTTRKECSRKDWSTYVKAHLIQ